VQGADWNLIITGKPLALKRNGQAVDLLWLLDDAVHDHSVRWLPPKCQTGQSDGRRVYTSEIGAEFGLFLACEYQNESTL